MRQIDDPVRLRRRAANLERGPGRRVHPGVLARHIGGSSVCTSSPLRVRPGHRVAGTGSSNPFPSSAESATNLVGCRGRHTRVGLESSNSLCSSGESANHRFRLLGWHGDGLRHSAAGRCAARSRRPAQLRGKSSPAFLQASIPSWMCRAVRSPASQPKRGRKKSVPTAVSLPRHRSPGSAAQHGPGRSCSAARPLHPLRPGQGGRGTATASQRT